MISKLVYEYFKLSSLKSYSKCKCNALKIINNQDLIEDTLSNYVFTHKWNVKLNKEIKHKRFIFSIISSEKLSYIYRVHVNRNVVFSYNSTSRKLHKSNNEKFIFIITKEKNKFYINNVAFKEENPKLYTTLLDINLEDLLFNRYNSDFLWTTRLSDINILFDSYTKLTTLGFKNNQDTKIRLTEYPTDVDSTFISIDKIIKYARKYSLNYNKNYIQFNNSGGDCTNFVSQALNFSGLPQTSNWKPYNAAWIMVVPLRDYLIKNNFAIEYNEISQNPLGTIIQFFSPIKERFSHSGIITDVMDDGEILYCCHDYDKLDFPLSETYPIFYKRIRNLKIK